MIDGVEHVQGEDKLLPFFKTNQYKYCYYLTYSNRKEKENRKRGII